MDTLFGIVLLAILIVPFLFAAYKLRHKDGSDHSVAPTVKGKPAPMRALVQYSPMARVKHPAVVSAGGDPRQSAILDLVHAGADFRASSLEGAGGSQSSLSLRLRQCISAWLARSDGDVGLLRAMVREFKVEAWSVDVSLTTGRAPGVFKRRSGNSKGIFASAREENGDLYVGPGRRSLVAGQIDAEQMRALGLLFMGVPTSFIEVRVIDVEETCRLKVVAQDEYELRSRGKLVMKVKDPMPVQLKVDAAHTGEAPEQPAGNLGPEGTPSALRPADFLGIAADTGPAATGSIPMGGGTGSAEVTGNRLPCEQEPIELDAPLLKKPLNRTVALELPDAVADHGQAPPRQMTPNKATVDRHSAGFAPAVVTAASLDALRVEIRKALRDQGDGLRLLVRSLETRLDVLTGRLDVVEGHRNAGKAGGDLRSRDADPSPVGGELLPRQGIPVDWGGLVRLVESRLHRESGTLELARGYAVCLGWMEGLLRAQLGFASPDSNVGLSHLVGRANDGDRAILRHAVQTTLDDGGESRLQCEKCGALHDALVYQVFVTLKENSSGCLWVLLPAGPIRTDRCPRTYGVLSDISPTELPEIASMGRPAMLKFVRRDHEGNDVCRVMEPMELVRTS